MSAPSAPAETPRFAWLVPVAAVLLLLRKPWALHTPQLWAEDGSIFLQQDHDWGSRALIEPYNGYLHTLPRLIAWIASRTADVAWWPAIYNGLAFAIAVGVIARLASQRVALPHKPWLMLAIPFTVCSAEPIINVTNLQSITTFFLLLQLFTRPAANAWHRAGDLAILGLVGLNGPFALLFLPLYAWRAWRERGIDTWLALGVLGVCAAVQGWFLTRGGLALQSTTEPFHPFGFLAVHGARLVTWPLFGPAAVRAWPAAVHAALAVVIIGALLWRSTRATGGRAWRLPVTIVFGLLLAASLSRVRTDLWTPADMVNGDRYFFMPRVLVTWLLIAECFAAERAMAWSARGLCLLGLALNAPHFTMPAPPDYRWAEHCDPIRTGTPANILTLPEGWWIEYPGRPKGK
ncbi:MAG: hypothetical protein JNK23_17380 [Opitutaceae bacterium]|nr:hypothetical protein [Opitutaceae bacterium]